MKQEAVKRMRQLGVPEALITQFIENGIVPCTNERGEFFQPSKEILDTIVMASNNNVLVYLVNVSLSYGVLMTNCMYVSQYEEDRPLEFRQINDNTFAISCFVMSELTHKVFDVGVVTIAAKDGNICRVDVA